MRRLGNGTNSGVNLMPQITQINTDCLPAAKADWRRHSPGQAGHPESLYRCAVDLYAAHMAERKTNSGAKALVHLCNHIWKFSFKPVKVFFVFWLCKGSDFFTFFGCSKYHPKRYPGF